MKLQTDRLTMRNVLITDLEAIHALNSIPEVDQYNTLGIPDSIKDTRELIEKRIIENQQREVQNYTWVILDKSSEEFIGMIGMMLDNKKYNRGEVWYKIHPVHWNKGFATEAMKEIIHFGFETLHLHRIQAGCAVDNIASIRVLEKVGMTREGRGRKVLPLKSCWSDNFEYSILDDDPRVE